MRVLVLGGAGFLGRHVVAALAGRGHDRDGRLARVAPSHARRGASRSPRPVRGPHDPGGVAARRSTASTRSSTASASCASAAARRTSACTIARRRALAAACARRRLRLVHVSALALDADRRAAASSARSCPARRRYARAAPTTRSCGRRCSTAKAASARAGCARWRAGRCIACPRTPSGRIAVLDVEDAGVAIARLCRACAATSYREVELGGLERRTLAEHLAALRRRRVLRTSCACPRSLARVASHAVRRPARLAVLVRTSRAPAPRQRAAAEPPAGAARRAAAPRSDSGMTAQERLREIAPAFRRAQSAMVEVHRARERRERPRRQRRVEHRVGHAAVVEHRAAPASHTKRGALRASARPGSLAAFELVIRDRLRRCPSRLERRVDAARRQRRHETGRVADQEHVAWRPSATPARRPE